MGANIHWQQVNKHSKTLGLWAPEAFMETIERAFGRNIHDGRVVFDEKDTRELRAMAAMWTQKDINNPYEELADIIEQYGAVELWAEY